MLTIALSKGRILDDTLPLLAEAGIVPTENPDKSRKLIIPTTQDDVRLLIVRATDVPTYVEHGAADLGVAGKDVLMEYGGQGLYEPLDLRIALCKLMTAGRVGDVEPKGRLRVATKFVNVAKRYYAEQGRQVDIIKLYGSMELAPLIGLADKIIDVVDTAVDSPARPWVAPVYPPHSQNSQVPKRIDCWEGALTFNNESRLTPKGN